MAYPDERLAPAGGEAGAGDTSGSPYPYERTADISGALEEGYEDRSLLEDLQALYADGRNYASAELTFQKTRASFAAQKGKSLAIFGAGAALAGLLALIGLTVGAILTLATLIGPLAATLVVVGILLLVAFLFARRAAGKWKELSSAFSSSTEKQA